jgi:hypothetical protein
MRGWGVSVTPRPQLTPGKDWVPIVQGAGWASGPVWTGAENLASTGIRSADRRARRQSLYPLRYPAHDLHWRVITVLCSVRRLVVTTQCDRCEAGSENLGAFTKLRKSELGFVMPVCLSVIPNRTTRLPLDGFSLDFIFGYLSKICLEDSSFIKIWQKITGKTRNCLPLEIHSVLRKNLF